MEGLERLVLELQNATVGRSLHMCLQTALLAPPDSLVIAVQTCLLEHNVVGEYYSLCRHSTAVLSTSLALSGREDSPIQRQQQAIAKVQSCQVLGVPVGVIVPSKICCRHCKNTLSLQGTCTRAACAQCRRTGRTGTPS